MVAATRGSGALQFCTGQLLPGLIEFIARQLERDGLSKDQLRIAALQEALTALAVIVDVFPADQRMLLSPVICRRRRMGPVG